MTFDAHPRVSNRPPRPLADRQPPNISHGQRAPPTGRQPLRCLAPPPNELRMLPTPLRPSGFSRQPPSGGLNLAIKAYVSRDRGWQTGSQLARAGEEELHVSLQLAVVAGAEVAAGTAWVTTPLTSPASEKLVESVGKAEVLPGGRGPGRASPHPRPHGPLWCPRDCPFATGLSPPT